MILKKSWFSDLEIVEIFGQVSHEEHAQEEHPKRAETKNTDK